MMHTRTPLKICVDAINIPLTLLRQIGAQVKSKGKRVYLIKCYDTILHKGDCI